MDLHNFHIYIVTNPTKTVLYIGVTNDLPQRLIEHFLNKGTKKTFTGRYNCYNLLYYENFQFIEDAIAREKELKGWSRKKKEVLIATINPDWEFLNPKIMGWPPDGSSVSRSSN